ncbi:MAG: hypothetical protein JWQ98_3184 [Chlorobi bacterium]|nr:hypothetical protein [Chlorobiota bacterium]
MLNVMQSYNFHTVIFRHLLACAAFAAVFPFAVHAQTFTNEQFHCRITIPGNSWYEDTTAERQMKEQYNFAWAFRSIDQRRVMVFGVIKIDAADTLDEEVVEQFVGQARRRGGIIIDTGYTALGGKKAFHFMLAKAPVKKNPPTYNVITLMDGYGYQFMILTADGRPSADDQIAAILNSFEFTPPAKRH